MDDANDLDQKLIMDEKIGLSALEDINQIILLSYDLETIIKLLRADPRLRKLIYNLMHDIVKNYKDNLSQNGDDIILFISDLIDLKEFTLVNRLISELENNKDLILNYDLSGILLLIKLSNVSDKLTKLLINLIPDIVIDCIESFEPADFHQCVEPGMNNFIKQLLFLREYEFAKNTMKNFTSILKSNDNYHIIIQDIFENDDYFASHVIEEYIKMIPSDFDMQRIHSGIKQTIFSESWSLKDDELIKYVNPILIAAVNLKRSNLIDIIANIFLENSELDISNETYEILKKLVYEARTKLFQIDLNQI